MAQYTVETVAGGSPPPSPAAALSAGIGAAYGIAVDSSGNVYFGSAASHAIFRLDSSGNLTLIAGTGRPGFSGDGAQATFAELRTPRGIALDTAGDIYFADSCRIRKISGGIISTFAGDGSCGVFTNGGQASGPIGTPAGLAFDTGGNLYFADQGSARVAKISSSGIVTTVAGTGIGGYGGDQGQATSAQLSAPQGVAVDSSGNVYIADTANSRIRKVTTNGVINTICGNGTASYSGDGLAATSATINTPTSVAVDSNGNVYIADANNGRVRKILAANGVISSVVSQQAPYALTTDSAGDLFYTSQAPFVVEKLPVSGSASVIAGNGTYNFWGDGGSAVTAQLGQPGGVANGSNGSYYILDSGNNRVRSVSSAGTITTVAGGGACCSTGDGGAATSAYLNYPVSAALDGSGNLYIAEQGGNRVRKVSAAGTISTIAGSQNGTAGAGGDNGPGTSAELSGPSSVAVDVAGDVYIADTNNNRVRVVSPSGVISNFAGNGTAAHAGDGGLATSAELSGPNGVAIDALGNVYISESCCIRKVSSGNITTVAGNGTVGYAGDGGPATSAEMNPSGIGLDTSGDIFVADGSTVREVSASSHAITRIGGQPSFAYGYSGDDGAATSALMSPSGVTVDSSGRVYVAESANNAVRLLQSGPLLSISSTHTGNFVQGQLESYLITVANAAISSPTTGTVTVTETVPAGMILLGMAGSGWTCTGGTNTCSRSDSLPAGQSYPQIIVTVNVETNATSPGVNTVSVSGGGSPSASTTDSTIVTPFMAAAITSPTPGSTLSGSTVTFTWSAGAGTGNAYWLRVGTTGLGSYDVSDLDYTGTSATVSGIPTNGETVYIRLYSLDAGNDTLVSNDYTYTAAGSGSFVAAAITSPSQGSTLSGSTVTFTWNAGTGTGNGHWLRVGTTGVGSYDISDLEYTGTSATVSGIPTNGGTVYVQLYSLNLASNTWVPASYTYTAAASGSGSSFVAAAIASPSQGSTLSGSTVTFTWSAGAGTGNGYWLRVGTTGVGSYDVSDLEYIGTSATLSGLPTNGGTVYVALYSLNLATSAWVPANYTYTAGLGSGSSFVAAAITSPSQGSTLSGSTVTFTWNAGTGTGNGHWLRVGTTGVGSYDVSDLEYAGTSATVSGIPTNGVPVYVQLYSLNPASNSWVPTSYTYTAGSGSGSSFVPAAITSPSQGSALSGSTVTFTWSAATGAGNGYWLRVGTTGAASYDVSDLEYSGNSATVSGIPTNGGTVYVTLYSLNPASNTWVPASYTYTAGLGSGSSFVPAAITTPSQGSTLSGSTVTFTWSAGTGTGNGYWLRVGTTGVGSYDLSDLEYAGTSATVSGIPTNGTLVYVTLYSLNPASNTWVPAAYTYTAF